MKTSKRRIRAETDEIKNPDVARTNISSRKKVPDSKEIEEHLNILNERIKHEFSADVEMRVAGLYRKYNLYQRNEYEGWQLWNEIEFMLKHLVNDCDEVVEMLITGSIDRKEADYERT